MASLSTPDTIALIAAVAALIGAVAALLTARYALLAAVATRKAAEGAAVMTIVGEYFQPEMKTALRLLRSWKDTHGQDFAPRWLAALKKQDKQALDVDAARRHVSGYFVKCTRLGRADLLSKTALDAVAMVEGINLLFDVVEPMEEQLAPTETRAQEFEWLEKHVGRWTDGHSVAIAAA
jgi:hypothetical protein